MKILYTRNYQRREERDVPLTAPTITAPTVTASSVTAHVSAENVPPGYCGTAILRDKEPTSPQISFTEKAPPTPNEITPPPPLRTRKFKVRPKVSPTLLQDASENEAESNTNTDVLSDTSENEDQRLAEKVALEGQTPPPQSCETEATSFAKKHLKIGHITRAHRKKHPLHRTPSCENNEKRFTLEDLLLGGIILLLLNEGADDGMILIFGYLLFSSF